MAAIFFCKLLFNRSRFLAPPPPEETWNMIALASVAVAATCTHILLQTTSLVVAVLTRCSQWSEVILFSVQSRPEAHR